MYRTNAANATDNSSCHNGEKIKAFENEVKINFMKQKAKNPFFFNEISDLPHSTSLPKRKNEENIRGFPKKKFNFFDELGDNCDKASKGSESINSYLF